MKKLIILICVILLQSCNSKINLDFAGVVQFEVFNQLTSERTKVIDYERSIELFETVKNLRNKWSKNWHTDPSPIYTVSFTDGTGIQRNLFIGHSHMNYERYIVNIDHGEFKEIESLITQKTRTKR